MTDLTVERIKKAFKAERNWLRLKIYLRENPKQFRDLLQFMDEMEKGYNPLGKQEEP